jgi:chromosome segregation ATPase
MITHGFTETQQHIAERLDTMDARVGKAEQIQKDMLEELNATHQDVRYLRRSVDMLVRSNAAQDAAIKTLATRVTRLEKKISLAN